MTSDPYTIDAGKSVAYAAKMLRDEDVGLAPIVEDDKLIGMLTDRDIAIRVVAEGRNPDQVTVAEVASKQVVTIDPQQELDEALRIMARFNTALQRALDDHPRAEDGVRVTFTADVVKRNPGGIREYKVTIGGH